MQQTKRKVFGATAVTLAAEPQTQWYEVARAGQLYDWRYGLFDLTRTMFEKMVENFDAGLPGTKLPLDDNHEPSHKAMAWVAGLRLGVAEDGTDILEAQFEDWTEDGAKCLEQGEFRYFSVDYGPLELPDGMGSVKKIPCVLFAVAFTNMPAVRDLAGTFSSAGIAASVMMAIASDPDAEAKINSARQGIKDNARMKEALKQFAAGLLARTSLSKDDVAGYQVMLAALPEADRPEFADTTKQLDVKCAESIELAAKLSASQPKPEEIAAMRTQLSQLQAKDAQREEDAAVASLMLSATNAKGFPEGKREEAVKLVKSLGTEKAREVAASLSHVTVLDANGVKQLGTSAATDTTKDAKMIEAKKLATERAKANGTMLHVELAQAYRDLGIAEDEEAAKA